jgi:sugar lactone lactonase YvrE
MLWLAASAFSLTATTTTLRNVVNLDYANGTVSVFRIAGDRAKLAYRFGLVDPRAGGPNGLAVHPSGLIYTAINSSTGVPCTACFEVLRLDGALVAQVPAPTLSGAPGSASLTDISVDRAGDVFLSDYGQQAVYYYSPGSGAYAGPNVVVQGTQNAASVAVQPNGGAVFVSGGCGFASVRPYTFQSSGWIAGNCFGIGTIALIGGAVDDRGDVFTPVDGAPGLVSISNADGNGLLLAIPDHLGGIGGVTLSRDATVLYVADHSNETVYAFARPAGGWLAGPKPKHFATYRGFKGLNVIAVSP